MELSDGFRIAEKDLELRGPGEFLGTRQHGLPELKLANLVKDQAILEQTRREAERIIQKDPMLKEAENRLLRMELDRLYSGKLDWALI